MKEYIIAHELGHIYIENQLRKGDPIKAKSFLEKMEVQVPNHYQSWFWRFWDYTLSNTLTFL